MSIYEQIEERVKEIGEKQLVGTRHDEDGNLACYYCGDPIGKYSTHRDHITPKSRGGLNLYWNIALTCADCNIRKSIKPPLFYLGQLPEALQVDFLTRVLLGGATAQRRFSPEKASVSSPSLSDIADKLATLSLQLQQITKWMHMIEQELI